ncbi:DnaJ-domain-containing protein [Phanerochaete sordida]|uniref:DnaJ-domain-containing protein n=1 Tax=Phanerochaete sordida TaxID=48140 RepID=A0A9P3G327_9APHY|nr:DnaJ-domain-containing protein [Phanerochaete sordida]
MGLKAQRHSFQRRGFQTSASQSSHYDTLSLPQTASKNQIKSSYYKLSKLYHPDLNRDPASKERFQKVGEAYAILGDDRKRRAYDRALVGDSPRNRHYAAAQPASAPYWAYETRRRPGATHAWQRQGSASAGWNHPGHVPPHPRSSPYTHPQAGAQYHRDPFSSPNVQKATGNSRPNPAAGIDRYNRISTFWRTMQVICVVMVVATVGNGLSAHA